MPTYYNALNRGPEVEVLPACGHYGLGVVPYSPLASGVLQGLGWGSFGNLMAPMTNAEAARTVVGAWDAGIRYFDTAPVYGVMRSYEDSRQRLGLQRVDIF